VRFYNPESPKHGMWPAPTFGSESPTERYQEGTPSLGRNNSLINTLDSQNNKCLGHDASKMRVSPQQPLLLY
jgi:hypothetical protein